MSELNYLLSLDTPELFPDKISALKSFLTAFEISNFKFTDSKAVGINQLSVRITFSDKSLNKINRFSQALLAFALFHGFAFFDDFLS